MRYNADVEQGEVVLYTDGACWGNPGPGGWAVLIRDEEGETLLSGREAWTTNNRMELKAVVEGLKALKAPSRVLVVSDSRYAVGGIGTRLDDEEDLLGVPNEDLWRELSREASRHLEVRAVWVRGHSGHPENERVDREAERQARLAKEELEAKQGGPLPLRGGMRPPTEKQLRYLEALGYRGNPPQTLMEASKLIDRLLRMRGRAS